MARRCPLGNEAAFALTLATLGCDPPGPPSLDAGGSEDAETGGGSSEDAETGDGSSEADDETGGGPVSFELVSANFDANGQIVVLHFSEPVAPVDGVEPSDFRISFARLSFYCDYDGCVPYGTSYYDPNFYADSYIGYYNPNSQARFEADLIILGADASTVSLHFETPLAPDLCPAIAPYEDDLLFVHHAPGDIPLESVDGETLAPIGPQFVHEPEPKLSVQGEFPDLDPKIPIPCSLEP